MKKLKEGVWSSGAKWTRKRFLCAYCSSRRTGIYRIVDGEYSCGKCNRKEDPPPPTRFLCPLCHGAGGFDVDGKPLA